MKQGYLIILAGYISWGLFPLYWSLLIHVAPLEVFMHRMLWSVPVLMLLVVISERRLNQVKTSIRRWQELRWLLVSGLLISVNWGIYIWAVANHRVVEASMGYFLSPLMNVITGVLLFREKLTRLNMIAIGFATAGVIFYIVSTSSFPWVGILVAVSFSAYGAMRKKMTTNAVPGLFIETLLLLPFTLMVIAWLHHNDTAMFLNHRWDTDFWLILGGPVTIIPLALFTAGARLLPMTTVGILFYVTPTLQFLSGIYVLGEDFDTSKMIGFVGIWIGLAIFSYSLIRQEKAQAAEPQVR
ncbi:MAG: EamA family transporter RarD [Pseudomonadota bacterium]